MIAQRSRVMTPGEHRQRERLLKAAPSALDSYLANPTLLEGETNLKTPRTLWDLTERRLGLN